MAVDDPQPNLTAASISRVSDLAHYMHERGIQVHVSSGETKSGVPVVSILAVGPWTGLAESAGEALIEIVAKKVAEARRN